MYTKFFFGNQFLALEAGESASIFQNLLSGLSTQQGEMTVFAKELKEVCVLTCTLLLVERILCLLRLTSHIFF